MIKKPNENQIKFMENIFSTDICDIPKYEVNEVIKEISDNRYKTIIDLKVYCDFFNKRVICSNGIIKGFLNNRMVV